MAIQLWKDRVKKIIDPELFSVHAEELAKQIKREATGTYNNETQLRKFYDEISRLSARAQLQREDWHLILPQVHMVIAKAAYANGRKLLSSSFVSHIREGISQIEEPQDLKIFSAHLEAFIGFYKMHSNMHHNG